jgi:hypothetical protein
LAFAVQDALHAVVQVGMQSVTVVVWGGGTSLQLLSQRFWQPCEQHLPQAPLCS